MSVKILIALGILFGLVFIAWVGFKKLTPWMDRWGAREEEIAANFPGDDLVQDPARFINRAVTIAAAPEEIYPWLIQIGADKGGWYSHTWLETHLLRCPMTNADRIHPEWQNLKVGDLVKMCPDEKRPPAYVVAELYPNEAIVLGHQEDGEWVDLYQFVILPRTDGTSRLILRTRTMMAGGFWSLIDPGVFVMERGLLNGVKKRAEAAHKAESVNTPPTTPTPEVFNPLNPPPTPLASDLPLPCQATDLNIYIDRTAGYCFAYPPEFTLGGQPSDRPAVIGPALDESLEPLRASLEIEVLTTAGGVDLTQAADAYRSSFQDIPWTIQQTSRTIAGEPAIILEPVPGQLNARAVVLLHNGTEYRLRFHPVDEEIALSDLETLFQTVMGSFSFIP